MNLQSILLLAAIIVIAAIVLYRYLRRPNKGCGCSGCEGCSLKGSCAMPEHSRAE